MITGAGYRIGPGEIEDRLMTHPDIALAAVVGVPDPLRTQAIQDYAKTRLAAHEYPRLIEFIDGLPMTTIGKIMRRELRAREAR